MQANSHDPFEKLYTTLPAIIARKEVFNLTGGLISPKTLANADSEKNGPLGKIKIGRNVGYDRESFIEWLKNKHQSCLTFMP